MEIFTILCLLTLNYFAADAYIRVERAATCPKITDFPGRVKYRRRGTRAVFKCPKKFDRHGPKFATCQKDGTWSNDPPLCIKTGCVPLDPSQVTKLDMEVVNGAFVQFSCLDGYMLIGAKQAYCDGKDWSAPLPRCAALHELSECDFEKDLCGWTQDDVEEQDWIRQMGPTQTGNTGPKHDHTLGDSGNGHYLYFETSSPSMAGHKANLLSPVYTADFSPMCFDFWYHILGPEESGHVGSLEVFILDQSQFIDDDDVQPVFIKKGNQGDTWHRGDIFIDTQPESYQIAIVATKALSYISDIAFDDVRLYNCSQSTSTTKADTSTTTTSTSTTTSTGITTVDKTVTSSATPVTTKITITTKTESPTTTTIKTGTITESPTSTTKSTIITESLTPVATKTSTFKSSSPTAKPTPFSTAKQTVQPTMKPTGTSSNKSPNTNTRSSVFTKTTLITPKSTKFSTKTTTAPTELTEKTKTSKQKTSETSSKSTSTTSRTITTASPVASQMSYKSTTTSKSQHKSTVQTTTQATSGPTAIYTKTTTFSERTTEFPVKTDIFTRDSITTSTSSRVANTSSSSFSSSSYSTSSSNSSSSFSSSSSYSTSSESKTGGTKPQTTPPNSNTKKKVSKVSSEASKTVKPTKRTNDLTTKSSNTFTDNTISVSPSRSQHHDDDTLKPLMIGLCVGIVVLWQA